MNEQIKPEMPEDDVKDKLEAIIKSGISELPGGGFAVEIFEQFFAPSIEKRRDEWLESVIQGLMEEIEDIQIEQLRQNESFITTFMQAYSQAIRTHLEEKRQALRNAVLNTALPNAPNDTKQKMFIEWLGELTPYHIKILNLFNTAKIPAINLDDNDWRMNMELNSLADVIVNEYPELKNEFDMFVQIIHELHLKGLISNKLPSHGLLTKMLNSPTLTPLATEFLKFIQSPIESK